ncbi:hypothetical protein QL285_004557 [Trifolium repens]|nr:hypothetical protein QL285_004557 [Trifolium repens]
MERDPKMSHKETIWTMPQMRWLHKWHQFRANKDNKDSNDEFSRNWYLDSGCSNYMAKDESIFKDIDDSVKVKVQLGNGTVVESKGKGTVMVETKKGDTCSIYDNNHKRH